MDCPGTLRSHSTNLANPGPSHRTCHATKRKLKIMKHKIYSLLTTAVLLFIAPACVAQTQFPDTPAGKQAKAWLEVFNAGDAEKHKEFLRKNAPSRLDRAEREMGFREMSGGFDMKKVEESTPTKLVALVQERASGQFRSEEHTSELQSQSNLVCRLRLE